MIIYYPPWDRFWFLLNASFLPLTEDQARWTEWASDWLDNNGTGRLKETRSFFPDEKETKQIYLLCAGFSDACAKYHKTDSKILLKAQMRKRFVFAALCLFEAQRSNPISSEAAQIARRTLEDLENQLKNSLINKPSEKPLLPSLIL